MYLLTLSCSRAQLLALVPAKATKEKPIQTFLKQRDSLLEDMKRPNLPGEVINWVYVRSAGICEFEGCPAELFRDNLGNYGYYGYLAHIVAAKPKGPRGDGHLSAELAQSPSNIMLCCDIHHRLIDKVDPDSFSRERLEAMVATRVNWRTNQAATLSYPIVHALAFIGDIAGRTTTFSQHDARKALLAAHLTPVNERVAEYLLRDAQGGNDVNDPGYWANFLRVFRAPNPPHPYRESGAMVRSALKLRSSQSSRWATCQQCCWAGGWSVKRDE